MKWKNQQKYIIQLELHQINLTFDQMASRQIWSNCFDQIIKISFFDQIIFFHFWWILTIWWKFDTFWSNFWPKRQNLKIWSKHVHSDFSRDRILSKITHFYFACTEKMLFKKHCSINRCSFLFDNILILLNLCPQKKLFF